MLKGIPKIVTLNHRGDEGTGWSKANKINLWARLLDGDHAYKILQGSLQEVRLATYLIRIHRFKLMETLVRHRELLKC